MSKGKNMSLFKSNATKPAHINNVYRGRNESRKRKTQTEDIIIKNIRNLFKRKKKAINDKIIREIKDTHNPLKPKFFRNLVFYVFKKFNVSSFVWIFVKIS